MSVAARPPSQDEKTGKIGGLHDRSVMARAQTIMKSYDDLELRNGIDVPMHTLVKKYPEQFARAEEEIEKRKSSWKETLRVNVLYDYDQDRRYKFWLDEKSEAKKHLKEHWLDAELDSYDIMWRHGVRIFSAFGVGHGIYRTHHLWSAMDKNYVKLHGIGLTSIASYEVPLSCLKGIALGFICAGGCVVGDIAGRLIMCYVEQTPLRQRRQWQNIACAGFFSGAFCGVSMWALTWNAGMTFKAQMMAMAATWSALMGTGVYLGKMVYDPWVKAHPLSYDDPHHVPWNERVIRIDGPQATRGRYV